MVTVLEGVAGNPIADTVQYISYPNIVPEAFNYDAVNNRIVLTSLNGGSIRGFPYNSIPNSPPITYTSQQLHTYVAGGTQGMYATSGILTNATGNPCIALVCMGSYPPSTTAAIQTGLYMVNLCTDSIVSKVALPSVSGFGSFANDVTVAGW